MKLEKSQIREKVHIISGKDNYPLHTLLKSITESLTKIKVHYMPKIHAIIQPELTGGKSLSLKSCGLQMQRQVRSVGLILLALTTRMERKTELSKKQTPAFLLEPTYQISTTDHHIKCCRVFLQAECCTSLHRKQAKGQPEQAACVAC